MGRDAAEMLAAEETCDAFGPPLSGGFKVRSACLYGNELRIEERPEPTPAKGELLIAVDHVGVCGSDLHADTYRATRRRDAGDRVRHVWPVSGR